MKNFQVRIWDAKNQQMFYPSESFEFVISLCGEVFRGAELKRQEDCKIMLFTGTYDVDGNEIYEGDIVTADYGDEYEVMKGRSVVTFNDGEFYFIMGRPERINWVVCKFIVKDFKVKVVDNIYEKAKRKAQKCRNASVVSA